MPPKKATDDTTANDAKRTWPGDKERDFILEILERTTEGGLQGLKVPHAVHEAIAEKWGTPHTKNSLM